MAISPLSVATDGYIGASASTISIATNGFSVTINVTEPQPPPTGGTDVTDDGYVSFGGGGFGIPYFFAPDKVWKDIEKEEQKIKEITVTVLKDGIEYQQKAYTNDLTIEAKDINFELTNEKNEIKIKIYFD